MDNPNDPLRRSDVGAQGLCVYSSRHGKGKRTMVARPCRSDCGPAGRPLCARWPRASDRSSRPDQSRSLSLSRPAGSHRRRDARNGSQTSGAARQADRHRETASAPAATFAARPPLPARPAGRSTRLLAASKLTPPPIPTPDQATCRSTPSRTYRELRSCSGRRLRWWSNPRRAGQIGFGIDRIAQAEARRDHLWPQRRGARQSFSRRRTVSEA